MNVLPITKRGEALLKKELQELVKVRRPAITQAIADAREHGDLKENAEYHSAREMQGFCEARIKDIEYKLSNSQVINTEDLAKTGKVVFGSRVTLLNLETEQTIIYRIVGDDEADIKFSRINVQSPIAKGLLGKVQGDCVEIKIPSGKVEFEILEIDYTEEAIEE